MTLLIASLFSVAIAGDFDVATGDADRADPLLRDDHDATLEIECDVPSNSFEGQSNVLEVCVNEENCDDYYGGEYPYCHHILYRSLWDKAVGNEGTHSCMCKNVEPPASSDNRCGTTVIEGELTERDLEGLSPDAVELLLALEAEGS